MTVDGKTKPKSHFICIQGHDTTSFFSPGCSSESVDVHGELLLPLLHGGQSLHWAAQVHLG